MLTLAVGATFAFADSTKAIAAASDATRTLEIWRGVGYLVFAAIFATLARHPRRYPGLWEISFLHTASVGTVLLATTRGTIAIDVAIAAILVVGYLLTRGDFAWRTRSSRRRTAGSFPSGTPIVP